MSFLDITMTAVMRPDIIRQTLDSFIKNMLHNTRIHLIINVDPVGDPQATPGQVMDVCRLYADRITYNFPKEPDFTRAFKWVWSQASSPLVFHLEDDWQLLRPVSYNTMANLMILQDDLAILRLPMWKTDMDACKNWSHWYPWNGHYFECPVEKRSSLGFCGHPSLIKLDFIKSTLPFLNDTMNPEKQFHYNLPIVKEVMKYRFGVFSKQNKPAAILDIGSKWRNEHGFNKGKNRAFFRRWEKNEEA